VTSHPSVHSICWCNFEFLLCFTSERFKFNSCLNIPPSVALLISTQFKQRHVPICYQNQPNMKEDFAHVFNALAAQERQMAKCISKGTRNAISTNSFLVPGGHGWASKLDTVLPKLCPRFVPARSAARMLTLLCTLEISWASRAMGLTESGVNIAY
jgi:hypothetical protein